MAVFCGVCAERIDSAPENYGSFRADDTFRGWDGHRIADTCASCAKTLSAAVAKAATKIAAAHKRAVDKLRREVQAARAAEKKNQADKAAFERAWHAGYRPPTRNHG